MSTRPLLTGLTALALACSGVLVANPATAGPPDRAERSAPRWGPVRTLAPNPRSASIAVDGRGTTTVAWSTSDFPARVVAQQRFANGTWGKKAVLGNGYDPQVVADKRGVTTVVWITQREGFSDGVVAARRTRSTDWSAPTPLSRDLVLPGYVPGADVRGATDPDVAVNRGGALVVAWTFEDEGVDSRIQSAYRPEVGRWRKAVDVTPANDARMPEVGIAADGTAMVVYGVQPFGEPQALASRVRGIGGRWSSSSPVTAEGYSFDLAVAPDGRAVVVFTPDFSGVRAATRPAGGKWQASRKLVTGGELNDVDVTVGRGGRFVVGIARGEGRVEVVERGARGGWSDPVRLADGGTVASDVMVAVNDAGDTYVGWGSYGVYGRYRPHDGAWTRRYTARRDSGVDVLEWASAVVAPNGDVPVLWDQEALPLRMRVLLTP
ncbi:hypothetical protein [Nocardioides dilutus]